MSDQSQVAEKSEVVGRAVNNPQQTYSKDVYEDDQLTHRKGDDNPCPIHFMYRGKIWSLPTGKTFVFPDELGRILVKRFPWLKTVIKDADKFPEAPSRDATEEEAPLLARARKEAGKGRKLWALTSTGDRVLISSTLSGADKPALEPSPDGGIEESIEDDKV